MAVHSMKDMPAECETGLTLQRRGNERIAEMYLY